MKRINVTIEGEGKAVDAVIEDLKSLVADPYSKIRFVSVGEDKDA